MACDTVIPFRSHQKQLLRRSLHTIKALCDEMAQELDADKNDNACDTLATLIVITDQLGVALVNYALGEDARNSPLAELFTP